MKSGDFSISRDDAYYGKAFSEVKNHPYRQRTFSARAALVAKETVNGRRIWKNYDGGSYDPTQFELVEGMWDHEHCSICFFTITEGFTYWESDSRIKLLCDACHEAFLKA
jgi:hypothetical protein